MAYQPLTLRQVAAAIREEQTSPDGDPWLWVRQFMDDFYAATRASTPTSLRSSSISPSTTSCPSRAGSMSLSGSWSRGGSRRSSRACTRWHWLNDAVKLYLRGEDPEPLQPLDLSGLRVLVASPRYLLALKLLASRREDEQDIGMLLNLLQIQSVDEALAVVLQVYPEGQILPKTRFMLEEIFGGQSHGNAD
jgi:hypothetical protein